jgi:hypothetical protein
LTVTKGAPAGTPFFVAKTLAEVLAILPNLNFADKVRNRRYIYQNSLGRKPEAGQTDPPLGQFRGEETGGLNP